MFPRKKEISSKVAFYCQEYKDVLKEIDLDNFKISLDAQISLLISEMHHFNMKIKYKIVFPNIF